MVYPAGTKQSARFISSCVTCRRLRRPTELQKMACLPDDRLEPAPPFSYSAIDFFGPLIIEERRSDFKRYGVLFTCIGPRSVHLERDCGLSLHLGSSESRKTLEQKFISQIGTPNPHGINERFSFNLFTLVF